MVSTSFRSGRFQMLLVVFAIVAAALPGWAMAQTAKSDERATAESLFSAAKASPPVAGPSAGTLHLDIQQLEFDDTAYEGVKLTNALAEVRFGPATPVTDRPWKVSLSLRVGHEPYYRIWVDADGRWKLERDFGETVVSGQVSELDAGPELDNVLDVLAAGNAGYVWINSNFIGEVPLDGEVGPGAVTLQGESFAPGAVLNYEGLTVWSLDKRQRMDTSRSRAAAQQESPEADRRAFSKALEAVAGSEPICGPRSGAMPLGEPGHINHADCDIAVADFVAHVVVRQSEFDPDKSWDFGLAFRVRDGESQYRLNVESTRHWYLLAGTAAPIATGPLPDLPLEPDTPIAVDLVVHGDSGYFGIDGEFVARLDLALLQNEGPVELVSGLFQENVSTSAKLQYQDFTVIPL